ncbi:uncharacterized protein PG986_012890 [Apiospora aurea]|uniref:Uncharacterized protein n=1 Tax=Apiospora aurea TaxID=335848 RepID=A0ABR1Q1Y8_9PEZI
MSYHILDFHNWVTSWERETIQKTSPYDGLGNDSLEIENEGLRTVSAIRDLLLDRNTTSEIARQLVDIRWTDRGGQGMETRAIWKVLCLAIEVFCCHRRSRVKLASTVVKMAPFELLCPAETERDGTWAGWSEAFKAHFASGTSRPSTYPSGPPGEVIPYEGVRRLLYSASAFQATWLTETWVLRTNPQFRIALYWAKWAMGNTLVYPLKYESDSYLEDHLPAALEWIRIAGPQLFEVCTTSSESGEFPFGGPFRFDRKLWDQWKANLASVQNRPGLDEGLKEQASIALEYMTKWENLSRYGPRVPLWLNE